MQLERSVPRGLRELLVQTGLMEQSVRLVHGANLVKMVLLDLKVTLVRQVPLVLKVNAVRQARWDPQVPLVRMAKMEPLVQ